MLTFSHKKSTPIGPQHFAVLRGMTYNGFVSEPYWIRTSDTLLKRQVLCQTELTAHRPSQAESSIMYNVFSVKRTLRQPLVSAPLRSPVSVAQHLRRSPFRL